MITLPPAPAQTSNASTTPVVSESAVPLKVTIVYDGVPAGRRAVGTMQRLIAQGEEPTQLVPHLWRRDLLCDVACRARATADAVASDLLILAAHGAEALAFELEDWVADLIARHPGLPVTILAMWGVEDKWTVSLLERNVAGRLVPVHGTDSPAASRGPRRSAMEQLAAA